jgi:hypothetical protein
LWSGDILAGTGRNEAVNELLRSVLKVRNLGHYQLLISP